MEMSAAAAQYATSLIGSCSDSVNLNCDELFRYLIDFRRFVNYVTFILLFFPPPQINVTFLSSYTRKSGKRRHHRSGGGSGGGGGDGTCDHSISDNLASHPLLRKRSESECEYR